MRNTGDREGAEVVQLYVGFPDSAGEPPKVLKAFRKVQLNPGQRATVTLTLDRRDLSVWNEAATRWASPTGRYRLMVGSSSRDIRATASIRQHGCSAPTDGGERTLAPVENPPAGATPAICPLLRFARRGALVCRRRREFGRSRGTWRFAEAQLVGLRYGLGVLSARRRAPRSRLRTCPRWVCA